MSDFSQERRRSKTRRPRFRRSNTNPRFLEPIHSDVGLQPERSSLSWVRTCFSLFILLLVQLRLGHFTLFPTLIIIGATVWVFFTATTRYENQARGVANEKYHPNTAQVLGLAALVLAMCIAMILTLF